MEGEALTSWLVRIAEARGRLPFQLMQDLVPGLQFWNRDGDLLPSRQLTTALASRTTVPELEIGRLQLRSLEGVLDERIDGVSQSPMVRPLGVYHRVRRAHGQQYCPACLDEPKPYYRLTWRLTLFPTCTRHGLALRDDCPACATPIVPHRGGLTRCHACASDLRCGPLVRADPSVLQLQHHGQRVLAGHPVTYPGLLGIHPLAFFGLQLHLMSRLLSPGRFSRLRDLAGSDGLPDTRGARPHPRHLTSASAHTMMSVVERLLRGWPFMLIGHCLERGVYRSWLLGDVRSGRAPFELHRSCAGYLSPGSARVTPR